MRDVMFLRQGIHHGTQVRVDGRAIRDLHHQGHACTTGIRGASGDACHVRHLDGRVQSAAGEMPIDVCLDRFITFGRESFVNPVGKGDGKTKNVPDEMGGIPSCDFRREPVVIPDGNRIEARGTHGLIQCL